jgi:NADH:ubiquinone oxidoreductase subunit F (NADH-binding)
MVAFVEGTDYRDVLRHWLEFMAFESCGRCVACRLGSQQALSLAASLDEERAELEVLLGDIVIGSLCAFGRNIPTPVRQLLALID